MERRPRNGAVAQVGECRWELVENESCEELLWELLVGGELAVEDNEALRTGDGVGVELEGEHLVDHGERLGRSVAGELGAQNGQRLNTIPRIAVLGEDGDEIRFGFESLNEAVPDHVVCENLVGVREGLSWPLSRWS